MKPLIDCRLYTFVDAGYLRGTPPQEVAAALCEGGSDLIQLRAKGADLAQIRQMAESILRITRPAGVGLVINDHPALAQELGAEFCHLGQEDFFGMGFKRIAQIHSPGSPLQIGLSTHQPAEAERAVAAGANYIAIGPVYATGTKPTAKPVTLAYVRWAAAHVQIPWFAIGGINLQNLDEVIAAGARRICVVSDILNASDLVQRCKQFKAKLDLAIGQPTHPSNLQVS